MEPPIFTDQIYIGIAEKPIELNKMYNFINDPSHGAISTFVGTIRNTNFNKKVLGVSYDIFDSLAIVNFFEICTAAKDKWDPNFRIYLEHFKGCLHIGGISIAIGVSSKHRNEAIAACSFIIEQVKHNSPIWKQEHYEGNSSEWIKGHALCQLRK